MYIDHLKVPELLKLIGINDFITNYDYFEEVPTLDQFMEIYGVDNEIDENKYTNIFEVCQRIFEADLNEQALNFIINCGSEVDLKIRQQAQSFLNELGKKIWDDEKMSFEDIEILTYEEMRQGLQDFLDEEDIINGK